MHSFDIIGYAIDGALYCPDCADYTDSPLFADDGSPGDYCDSCLAQWLSSTSEEDRKNVAPSWVYLDGCAPDTDDTDDT